MAAFPAPWTPGEAKGVGPGQAEFITLGMTITGWTWMFMVYISISGCLEHDFCFFPLSWELRNHPNLLILFRKVQTNKQISVTLMILIWIELDMTKLRPKRY